MRIIILFGWLISTFLSAEQLILISNKKFPLSKLNTYQVRQIYLKQIHFIDDFKLLPLNLSAQDKLRKSFEQKILKMSPSQLREYWTKKHYKGKRPPLVQRSIKSVIAFVRKVDGSIAYIPESKISIDLKILYKVDK